MEISNAKKEWFPRQASPVGAMSSSKQGKSKTKRPNAGLAYRQKSKGKKKSKRYMRKAGSDSQQYDFNRKNKALV